MSKFDGTDEKYQKWWLRFKTCAKLGGISKEIRTTPEVDLPSKQVEAETLTGTEAEIKLKKRAKAMNY